MNYHKPISREIDDFDGVNFIEQFINLYVAFYNQFDNMDLMHIKTIIRPNNVQCLFRVELYRGRFD